MSELHPTTTDSNEAYEAATQAQMRKSIARHIQNMERRGVLSDQTFFGPGPAEGSEPPPINQRLLFRRSLSQELGFDLESPKRIYTVEPGDRSEPSLSPNIRQAVVVRVYETNITGPGFYAEAFLFPVGRYTDNCRLVYYPQPD